MVMYRFVDGKKVPIKASLEEKIRAKLGRPVYDMDGDGDIDEEDVKLAAAAAGKPGLWKRIWNWMSRKK